MLKIKNKMVAGANANNAVLMSPRWLACCHLALTKAITVMPFVGMPVGPNKEKGIYPYDGISLTILLR